MNLSQPTSATMTPLQRYRVQQFFIQALYHAAVGEQQQAQAMLQCALTYCYPVGALLARTDN